jgi:hypothetical protein
MIGGISKVKTKVPLSSTTTIAPNHVLPTSTIRHFKEAVRILCTVIVDLSNLSVLGGNVETEESLPSVFQSSPRTVVKIRERLNV